MATGLNVDLSYAVSDVYYSQRGGLFRADYDYILGELRKLQASQRLSQSYQDNVVEPLINYLIYQLPKYRFDCIFLTHKEDLDDPLDKNIKSVLPILLEALLQRNYERVYYRSAFEDLLAFQSIIDTIYDLAIHQQEPVSAPMPPLVAWVRERKGPFTFTAAKIVDKLQIPVGVVCLPPEYRGGGLLAWSVMGHEVAGHNFIQSKAGMLDELTAKVKEGIEIKLTFRLTKNKMAFKQKDVKLLSEYWSLSQRVEELASDLLGVLSTGPALAIGCIGYFRGMSEDGLLKTVGPFESQKKRDVLHIQGSQIDFYVKDLSEKVEIKESQGKLGNTEEGEIQYKAYKVLSSPHPIQVLRPFAMIEAIRQTHLDDSSKDMWANLIDREVISKEFAIEKFGILPVSDWLKA